MSKSKVVFRSRYDGKSDERSLMSAVGSPDPADRRTKSSFKDESDINNILRKYKATGVLPNQGRAALAQYGDFSNIPDYHSALNSVINAQRMFEDLPSYIRNRFANDPGRLLEFLGDVSNRDEAVKLGLIDPLTGKAPAPSVEAQAPTSPLANGSTSAAGGQP